MKKMNYYILTIAALFVSATATVKAQEKLILSYTTSIPEYLKSLADVKTKPVSGTASSFQPGEGIERSFDDDMSTLYHSQWGNVDRFPITLQYNFSNTTDRIDYLVYHPRTSATNGNFKEINVFYKLRGQSEVKFGEFDFKGSGAASTIFFNTPLINPEYIKIVVKSGVGDNNGIGFASCAEMEFYKKNAISVDLSAYFADDIYSALKPGVTRQQIVESDMPVFFKRLALELMEDYSEWRVQEYIPYRPINDLVSELKTSTYNSYENPTGIYVEPGSFLVVFVPDTKGENISLHSRDWDTDQTQSYALRTGINYILPTRVGNTYISYYTSNYKTAEPIKIHIYGGKINGVFYGSKHNNDDWKNFLKKATSKYLDMVGTYHNMAFYVQALKTNCPSDGVRLVELYDEIVKMQYEQMGLFKYNRVPKNHMFSRNTLTGYMSAGGLGANFQWETMGAVGNPSNIIKGDNCWGIAHELGHVNQVRPGLRWIGTVECTNNIYSTYNQYMLTSKYSTLFMRLEHESCKPIDGESAIVGGRFNSHLHNGVLKGDNWMFQWGQDGQSDHFVKVVPMWQLNLYFKIADQIKREATGTGIEWGKPDWYGDVCEAVRLDNASYTDGQHQINFVKRACEATQTNLIEFFEKAGILKPVDKTIDDYGTQRLQITQKMCDDVKSYIQGKGWPEPEGVINYISGNSVKIYANKLPVEGTLNQGVTLSGANATVNHNTWKNAVVYETYAGNELIRITMTGTGNANNTSTRVPFPSNATKIVAVAWDGTRTTAYER